MSSAVTSELRALAENWDRLHSEPPAVLHHYTTAAGLMGIIGSQRVWGTNARFLNDPSEVRYALKVISEAVAEREKPYLVARSAEPALERVPDILARLMGAREPKIEVWAKQLLEIFDQQREIYVASFCEDGDLLSQWRGYAAAGGGYAIGITTDEIWGATDARPSVILRKVIYDPEVQRRVVSQWVQCMFDVDLAWRRARQEKIRDALQERSHKEPGHGDQVQPSVSRWLPQFSVFKAFRPAQEESMKWVTEIETTVTRFLAECLITFKDAAYHEEREWRAIQFGIDAPPAKFRIRGGAIVPYVELDLRAVHGPAPGRVPIRTITYGPTLEPSTSDRALKMLCATAGYGESEVTVRQSSIPYRGLG
jgi:hypothetical protein